MAITVEIEDVQEIQTGEGGKRITYRVMEDGRAFRIACRKHSRGREISLAGQEGFLYVDQDDGLVHQQLVLVGMGCGVSIEDEVVIGLSPTALQKVIEWDDRET